MRTAISLQESYITKWREYIRRGSVSEEAEQRWICQHYNDDYPAILINQLYWLQKIGFSEVDVLWKYYNFAVYGGRRPW